MPITFIDGWDSEYNHESGRSAAEVERIVREIPNIELGSDDSGGQVGMAVQMDWDMAITKGIHDRERNLTHITVRFNSVTYHLRLQEVPYPNEDSNEFIWRVTSISSGRD